jgi:UDP-N-acetylmuramoylalanine--D-glutamate ligase
MKIALLGFGIEAQSAYNFLKKKYPSATFDIYDQNQISKVKTPEGSEIFLGVSDFSSIDADLLVRTPAINPKDLPISANVTSVTNLFFEQCRAPIIGVTGSKGKGTTASFITEILRSAGLKVQLLGNIGIPALDKIDDINQDSIVVYELSSFQLWDLKYAPRVAVITNIEPDHLDVHDDFDDYVSAKMNITRLQDSSDFLVYNYLFSLLPL